MEKVKGHLPLHLRQTSSTLLDIVIAHCLHMLHVVFVSFRIGDVCQVADIKCLLANFRLVFLDAAHQTTQQHAQLLILLNAYRTLWMCLVRRSERPAIARAGPIFLATPTSHDLCCECHALAL